MKKTADRDGGMPVRVADGAALFALGLLLFLVPAAASEREADGGPGYMGFGFTVELDTGIVTLKHVVAGGPAEAAGMQIADVLVEVAGQEVRFPSHRSALDNLARMARAGKRLALTVRRDGQLRTILVVPTERPDGLDLLNDEEIECLDAPISETLTRGTPGS